MTDSEPRPALHVRLERPGDRAAIDALVTAAFGRPAEAALVRGLRQDFPERHAGFVATVPPEPRDSASGRIVGHAFYSPVRVGSMTDTGGMGLAPMAVLPEFQRRGFGSALLHRSLDAIAEWGAHWIVLVGHPEFYRRAGFRPGAEWGLQCEFPVPDEVFLVRELVPGALDGMRGTVHYAPRFRDLE